MIVLLCMVSGFFIKKIKSNKKIDFIYDPFELAALVQLSLGGDSWKLLRILDERYNSNDIRQVNKLYLKFRSKLCKKSLSLTDCNFE